MISMNRCFIRAIHSSGSIHSSLLHPAIRHHSRLPHLRATIGPVFSSMAYFSPREPIIVNPRSVFNTSLYERMVWNRSTHSGTIFMFHGLGDTGAGWQDVARRDVWGQNLPHVKFVFPTAPIVHTKTHLSRVRVLRVLETRDSEWRNAGDCLVWCCVPSRWKCSWRWRRPQSESRVGLLSFALILTKFEGIFKNLSRKKLKVEFHLRRLWLLGFLKVDL